MLHANKSKPPLIMRVHLFPIGPILGILERELKNLL